MLDAISEAGAMSMYTNIRFKNCTKDTFYAGGGKKLQKSINETVQLGSEARNCLPETSCVPRGSEP